MEDTPGWKSKSGKIAEGLRGSVELGKVDVEKKLIEELLISSETITMH